MIFFYIALILYTLFVSYSISILVKSVIRNIWNINTYMWGNRQNSELSSKNERLKNALLELYEKFLSEIWGCGKYLVYAEIGEKELLECVIYLRSIEECYFTY